MCWFFSEPQNTQAPSDTRQKAHALYSLCANRHRRATTPLYATVLLSVQSFFSLRGQLFFYISRHWETEFRANAPVPVCVRVAHHMMRRAAVACCCGITEFWVWGRLCILEAKLAFFEFLTGFSRFSGCESDSKVCLRRSLCRSVRSEYALQPSPWHLYTETNAKNKKNDVNNW